MNTTDMKNIFPFAVAACLLICTGCNNTTNQEASTTEVKKDSAIGKIELYDPAAAAIIDSNAVIEIIGRGFNWSEGPVWLADQQKLIFSDVPENKIFQWKQGEATSLFLTPSGYTDSAARFGETGSNGMTLDRDGRLLLCQSGNRQVARMNASLDSPKSVFTALATRYNGKRFNSPNDIVADRNNNIYFTDPIYGLPKGADDPERELTFEGVFKIDATGKLSLLIDSIPRPNGIALSLDETILYVASSDDQHPKWFAYQLDKNGDVSEGGVLLDATVMKAAAMVKQGADGFKIDNAGNIFSAGPDGINIISPAGKRLALIKVYGRPTSNCVFNETKDVLFITADDLILKVVLHR